MKGVQERNFFGPLLTFTLRCKGRNNKLEIEYTITEHDYVKAIKLAGVATKKQLIWLSLLGLLLLFFALFG